MTIFCANECDTEATHFVMHSNGRATPLCYTCHTAYEWGQCSPNSEMQSIEHVEGMVRQDKHQAWTWLVEEKPNGQN
jgi:hypothetical protein